ncbi:hypothetical protein LPW11_06755 [Geomonas sp. RF6]|uniref:hypothetical protein n=1 Tax=Geomonas sp. RF6 TaxID=2897342 RepID=UPI001E4C7ECF|nr:hypothetical protein [Geomonas sp. RF6]UFS71888.1 hypothetical protein LPW11_06755 [Geomonas sp. RF6]
MTVLLLASQARLLELFRSLEAQGMLQLQVASSITDAERLLSQNPPDFAFVQSRVSALSGEIVVRHIRSLLSHRSKIVLLSGDEEELKKAQTLQALAINLGSSDESLRYAVREVLSSAEIAQKAQEAVAPPEQDENDDTLAAPAEGTPPTPEPSPLAPVPPAEEGTEPTAAPTSESAFEKTLRAQQVYEPQPVSRAEAERQHPAEPPQKARRKRRCVVMAPARSLRDFASKSYLSPRKLRRRTFLLISIVVIGAAAVTGYLLRPETRETIPLPPRPVQKVPMPPAPAPAAPAQPAAPQGEAPSKGDEAVVPEPRPKPSASGKGLADLPPFVVDAEQDTEYGKTHPGWERYLTSRLEYKIFREGTLIKAVQIMAARDETVPGELFNWAKKEFAAAGPHKLLSKEQKGNYQVEKLQAEGAGLTVYRKVPDLKIRALVLYFR